MSDRDEKEEDAYHRVMTLGLLSLQQIPCSYGYRYKAELYDGTHCVLLAQEKDCYFHYLTDETGFWHRPDGRDFSPNEQGDTLDPYCPPYLEKQHHDIIEGHVTIYAHAPDGSEFMLRLPIEEVRALAKETEGCPLE